MNIVGSRECVQPCFSLGNCTHQGRPCLAFRALGRLGLFQPFIDRQRLVNTFVTNVRGPTTAMTLGGRPVVALIPIAVNPGNVGVSFDILSYGGLLGITVVADPDVVPDQDRLTDLLARELTELRA
ncbi:WS/DGAT domain-containing protein [Thioalkalivibrio sp.]|uniref:WS/DGAT domain-containing protein n=1 Tax=Thioalkalivibrio sp. TaxID=2093813 RepID=UPI003974F16C